MSGDFYTNMVEDMEKAFAHNFSKSLKRIDKDLLVRIILRLKTLSVDCEECGRLSEKLFAHINKHKQGSFQKKDYSVYQRLINEITLHLYKKHGLVKKGYYAGAFMTLGMSTGAGLGIALGTALFENIAIGMSMGLCFGLVIGLSLGAAKDGQAKKKGLII